MLPSSHEKHVADTQSIAKSELRIEKTTEFRFYV